MATRKTFTLVLPAQATLPDDATALCYLLVELLDRFLARGSFGALKGKAVNSRALQVATLFKEYPWIDDTQEILEGAGITHTMALPLSKLLLLAIPPEAGLALEHVDDGELYIDDPKKLPLVLSAECLQEVDMLLARVLPYIESQVKKAEDAAALRLLQRTEENKRQAQAELQRQLDAASKLLRNNGFEVKAKPKSKPKTTPSV